MKKESKISSIESYLKWVNECRTRKVSVNGKIEDLIFEQYHLHFRGQADKEWRLQPSVFRNKDIEQRLLRDAYRHAWKYLQDYPTDLEKMIVLQHYGLHTRLLDLTSNPLIALYFACVGEGQKDKDGKVFCFCSSGEEGIRIPKIIAKIVADGVHLGNGLNQYLKREYDIFYIRENGMPTKKKSFKKWKEFFFKPQFFLSPFNNNRITVQRGAFIIAPLNTFNSKKFPVFSPSQIEEMKEWHPMVAVVDAKYKKSLLEDLARLGIDESTIYPDLEHLLSFLNEHHKPYSRNTLTPEVLRL